MKPSELFGVVVRVTGLILSLVGIWQVSIGILNLVFGGPVILPFLLRGVPMLIIGRWFLRGAPKLITFAYPEE